MPNEAAQFLLLADAALAGDGGTMPTLKDLSVMTSELDRLGGELHTELTEGEIDFQKMVVLADTITENADKLAAAFNAMAEALGQTLNGTRATAGAGDGSDEQN
jgi:hypothetical protein